jgi:hypothetical protein
MNLHAAGAFEVRLAPIPPHDESLGFGRFSIDKQYQGDLVATAKGEMLSAMGNQQGSAAYVAIERVTGTLHGRSGSFVIHHRGIMTRGAPELVITIVPDSGTGELAGISGAMAIEIRGRDHFYTLDYELAATAASRAEPA